VIKERGLGAEQLAAVEAGHQLLVRMRADVLDEAVLVAHVFVAHGPVAHGLGSLVLRRLLYIVLKQGVLHYMILELDNRDELPLAVRPAAAEILAKNG